jgi:hypothetical protein
MTRTPASLGLVLAALTLPAVKATAQYSPSRTATNTVSVHVGTVLRLGVQGSTPLVRSNGAWRLAVSTAQTAGTPAAAPLHDRTQFTPVHDTPDELTVRLTLVGA